MTGDPSYANPRAGMELGADDFLLKPFSLGDLTRCVAARLKRAELSRHLESRIIEQLLGSLHSTLPHELFTPLAGVFGLTEMLEEELDDLSKEEIREILHDILKSARRLHRTLRNYLHIIELDSPSRAVPPNVLEAESVLQTALTGIKSAADRHLRTADVKTELVAERLRTSPTEFTALIEELVDNALSFSRKDSPVTVQLVIDGKWLRLTIRDEGRGMTPKQLQQLGLFQQHGRKKFEQQGLGLGLALARRIVNGSAASCVLTASPPRAPRCTSRCPSRTRLPKKPDRLSCRSLLAGAATPNTPRPAGTPLQRGSQDSIAPRLGPRWSGVARSDGGSSVRSHNCAPPQPTPISQPAINTSTPPTTTWNTAETSGVSM